MASTNKIRKTRSGSFVGTPSWLLVGVIAILLSILSDRYYSTVEEWLFRMKYTYSKKAQQLLLFDGQSILKSMSSDRSIVSIFQYLKTKSKHAWVHSQLTTMGRSLVMRPSFFTKVDAATAIPANELILEVPTSMQIWDIDAFRHPRVKPLLSARHEETGNPLHRGAFIALYLAFLKGEMSAGSTNEQSWLTAKRRITPESFQLWLDSLPDSFDQHPSMWDTERLQFLIPVHSQTYLYISTFRHMYKSEYAAFQRQGLTTNEISWENYQYYRLVVQTRAFGKRHQDVTEETTLYHNLSGIDLSQDTISLVFVADLLNSHTKYNLNWDVDPKTKSYKFITNSAVPSFGELYTTYGTYTEAYMLAAYGFVSGDGSIPISTLLSVFHDLLDTGMGNSFSRIPFSNREKSDPQYWTPAQREQLNGLVLYMLFDDGYDECINPNVHTEEFEFKLLKFKVLVKKLANNLEAWRMAYPARNPEAEPPRRLAEMTFGKTSDFLNPKHVIQASDIGIGTTCRILIMRHDDFDGEASGILNEILHGDRPFGIFSRSLLFDDPDFKKRTGSCVNRLAYEAASSARYNRTLSDEKELLKEYAEYLPGSPDWAAAHARIAELETLQMLLNAAPRRYGKETSPRLNPCPLSWSEPLIKSLLE